MSEKIPETFSQSLRSYELNYQIIVLDFNSDKCGVKNCRHKSVYSICLGTIRAKDVLSFSCKKHLQLKVAKCLKLKRAKYELFKKRCIDSFKEDARIILGIK